MGESSLQKSVERRKSKNTHGPPYSLSAHERGQLGLVDYLAGSGDVWESRLKAEG